MPHRAIRQIRSVRCIGHEHDLYVRKVEAPLRFRTPRIGENGTVEFLTGRISTCTNAPLYLMMHLTDVIPRDAVVVEEGLTATATLRKHLPFRDAQGFYGLASGGIGFAMAGAVGISLALRDRPIVAVVGDGSAMYSIQALWTAAHFKLPITYVIPNNRGYQILKERLKSLRGTDKFIGMDFVEPEIDFVLLAQSMGVPAQRITDPAEIGPAMQAALARSGPSLLDIPVANGFGQ